MTDIVCLSEGFDLKPMFIKAFARHAPGLRLLNPDEVTAPGAIRYALAHDPAPDAFRVFNGLQLICAWGADVFARMPSGATLIQLARGAHLVEPDLIAALDAGRPAMAALDVMAQEPLPADSPLWAHPRIMLTPHIASAASPAGVAQSVAKGIASHGRGEPVDGLVDLDRGY